MIKQWYSTTAAEFASMTDVTDEEVREASRGGSKQNDHRRRRRRGFHWHPTG